MPCNNSDKRKLCEHFIKRLMTYPCAARIGDRLPTSTQLAPLTGTQLSLRQSTTCQHGSAIWKLYSSYPSSISVWSGFAWNFEADAMIYTTNNNVSFAVTIPELGNLALKWEQGGCNTCKTFPAQTWRGMCILCERPACFCAGGVVKVVGGQRKTIETLVVGDVVESQAGTSTIRAVTVQDGIMSRICTIGDNPFRLTDKHPVFHNGIWKFPLTIDEHDAQVSGETVWNFVMDGDPCEKSKHTIVVNGVVCATLGCAPCPVLKAEDSEGDALYGSGFWSRFDAGIV
jgi:hypothetical protein